MWAASHAQLPTLDPLDNGRWRVFFAARDVQGRARTSYVEVASRNPSRVLYEHPEPILPLGKPDAFDSAGIMPGWVVCSGQRTYLYYTGWKVGVATPYELAIGIAASEDGGRSYEKLSEEPSLGLTADEPYAVGSPCVLVENGLWRCWYFCLTKWEVVRSRLEAVYHIRYAESADGINWKRDGAVAIDYEAEDEAIGRGSVLRDADTYRMWYSYRKTSGFRNDPARSYRIGYAESDDGFRWTRMDERAGITPSREGWDSAMLAYPYVFEWQGSRYMFYNGNGFGRTGFGYAVSE